MLLLIHLGLPLAILLLLAFRPASQRAVWLLQIAATTSILLALHLAGLWIILPWWTPLIYWALLTLALWRGQGIATHTSFGGADIVVALFWTVLFGAGGWITVDAVRARIPPAGNIAQLALPLSKGNYFVASGGSRELLNAHLRTLPRATLGQRNYWGQSYGVDMIVVDRFGLPSTSGAAVLAPCTGKVIRAIDGFADGVPVDVSSPTARSGNHALIRCGDFIILLAHFRKGSLVIAAGEEVRTGQYIAILGNSGASDMPHLHIHAQRPGTDNVPFSGQPIPMRIDGRYLVRGDRP